MTPTIHVQRINAVYIKLTCEPAIEQELSEFFTFVIPNAHFHPLVKARKWDGRIHLYSKRTGQIGAGLERHLAAFAAERGYGLQGDVYVASEYALNDARSLQRGLRLPAKITEQEHQILAVTKALRYRNVIVQSPTASGKSLIAYMLIRHLLFNPKGLLIVPTVNLVNQMYSDFQDYSTDNKWDVEVNCQKIYEGHTNQVTKPFVISTWQSIFNLPKSWFEQFTFAIGDEVHLFEAKSLGYIMTSLTNAKYRIGMTGTLKDAKIHRLALEGYFGPIVKIATTEELIKKKILSDLTVKSLVLKYPEQTCLLVKKMDYREEIDFLVSNEARNTFLMKLALSLKGNTLLLFQLVERHGDVLFEQIQELNKNSDRKIFFVAGRTEAEEREEVRTITETQDNAIIIASFGVFSTGVNIKKLHNLIFGAPSKAKIRILQSIGRVLRTSEEKDIATIYDIADDLRCGTDHVNYAMKHYAERIALYTSERFKIKTYSIQLKG